jgi:hypothetical protein
MIPKILHYAWFSDELPTQVQSTIDIWQRLMPDYQIIRWNASNFPVQEWPWVEQALERKAFAFATDCVRFYALAQHGGIYLDSDVQALRPFDSLLGLPYFLGREKTAGILECAVMGAEKETPWVCDMLDYYKGRNFVTDGVEDRTALPYIVKNLIAEKFGMEQIQSPRQFDMNNKKVQVLPAEYFSPKRWSQGFARVTPRSYCVHWFEGAWTDGKVGWISKMKNKVMDLVGEDFYMGRVWKAYGRVG